MPKIAAREYKLMLQASRLAMVGWTAANSEQPLSAESSDVLHTLGEQIGQAARRHGIQCEHPFGASVDVAVALLDTEQRLLGQHELVLRRRHDPRSDRIELTLKCRSADRYIAAESDVAPTPPDGSRDIGDEAPDVKFEEDIAAPFRSRFSHSGTLTLATDDAEFALGNVRGLSRVFRGLKGWVKGELDEHQQHAPLEARRTSVMERVWKGPRLLFPSGGETGAEAGAEGTVALILWSPIDRPETAVAELSFRCKSRKKGKERFSRETAVAARSFFAELQQLPIADRADAVTKTEWWFGDTVHANPR